MLLAALLALGGRTVLDLDAGWQFARVPDPPSAWNGPDAVPTARWRVLSASSQETAGEDARAERAFDGDPQTYWHTEWSQRQAPYPHTLRIDLGAPTDAVGVRLLPRQGGPQNGRPRHFRLLLDDRPVFAGEAPDSSALFEARFPRASGRVLTLAFDDGHRPKPFLVLAEVGLIRPGAKGAARAGVPVGSTPDEARRIETPGLAWSPATLPHAAWARPLGTAKVWQGVVYYRRRLPTPPPERRAVLELRGMQSVDAWLDGKPLASRRGGYLPLRTEVARGGELLVRVDNRDDPLIPPGKPQRDLDFVYGAGLVGNASLTLTDPLHITDPLEVDAPHGGGVEVEPPTLGKDLATTWVRTNVRNAAPRSRHALVRQTLFDPMGRRVATAVASFDFAPRQDQRFAQTLDVPHPRLWSPDSPALYRLRTAVEAEGRVLDAVETMVGLRTVAVSPERGFLLNGKPLHLVGTNRHEDYPWVGPALSDAAQQRDALLIKRSGHNIVRLSHYDQSPAFLDACDRLGILTIPCIPGWQFMNDDPRFKVRVLRDIRELIRRDRNHPTVAWWEAALNETGVRAEVARSWHDAAHAEGAALTAGDATGGAPWEVVYNGWQEGFHRPEAPGKPAYIREYGDYEFGGTRSTTRARIGDGPARLMEEAWNHVWSYDRYRAQYPQTMGAGTWEMFDHDVPYGAGVSASGLADLMRREKPSFAFYASQEARGQYLKMVLNPSPLRGRGVGVRGSLVVFTNAVSATLYAGGKLIQTQKAPHGAATGYDLARAFDGSNTANLAHPPMVFEDVPPGSLKIVGSNGAQDVLRLAGKSARLRVWLDDLGVPPTRNDLVFVRAAVVDAAGTVCAEGSRRIAFAGAAFAGESAAPCEMGVASVLVRTPVAGGRIVVRATAGGLKGECAFVVR